MWRKLLLIALLLVIVAIGGVMLFAGSLVRAGVERGGKYALGVDTKLDSASVSPMSGHLGLHGLEIANPSGFKGPYFLRLESADMNVSTASLTKDVVEAKSFLLDGIDLYLERANGKTNYGELLDSLKKLESKDKKKPAKGEPEEGGKKFVIRDVRLTNLRVRSDFLPELGSVAKVAVTIPEIHLEDVGNAEGGASVSEVISELLQAVLAAVVKAGGSILPTDLVKDVTVGLGSLGGDALEKLGKGIGGALDGLGKGLDKVFK
jgi:hypothetical protein